MSSLKYRPMEAVRADMQKISRDVPELTVGGIGMQGLPEGTSYDYARHLLLSNACCSEFERARNWLLLCNRVKRFNRQLDSYGLKREAEAWISKAHPTEHSFIGEGPFIAAAMHLGFLWDRRLDTKSSVWLNIALPRG